MKIAALFLVTLAIGCTPSPGGGIATATPEELGIELISGSPMIFDASLPNSPTASLHFTATRAVSLIDVRIDASPGVCAPIMHDTGDGMIAEPADRLPGWWLTVRHRGQGPSTNASRHRFDTNTGEQLDGAPVVLDLVAGDVVEADAILTAQFPWRIDPASDIGGYLLVETGEGTTAFPIIPADR